MRMIQEAAGTELKWEQPPMFTREYELNENAGIAPLATLKWVSSLGTRAVATVHGRTYTFEREGVIRTRIVVREGDTKGGEPLAIFKQGWTGKGTITFPNAKEFHWQNTDWWYSNWKWVTADDGHLMHFVPEHQLKRLTRSEAKVTLDAAIADFPEAEILVPLGWYLMLLRDQDAASTGSA